MERYKRLACIICAYIPSIMIRTEKERCNDIYIYIWIQCDNMRAFHRKPYYTRCNASIIMIRAPRERAMYVTVVTTVMHGNSKGFDRVSFSFIISPSPPMGRHLSV